MFRSVDYFKFIVYFEILIFEIIFNILYCIVELMIVD